MKCRRQRETITDAVARFAAAHFAARRTGGAHPKGPRLSRRDLKDRVQAEGGAVGNGGILA